MRGTQQRSSMNDTKADARTRQEELGQFLTAKPVADFMASMFGPLPSVPSSTERIRWAKLIDAIIEVFRPRWYPSAAVLSLCDPEGQRIHHDAPALAALGLSIHSDAKLPDLILHDTTRHWLLLIEAVTSAGPVDGKRRKELKDLFAGCKAGLVFVTAFENRRTMQTFVSHIAWESEVWIAEDPDHMIHFNGERFLGPYPDVMPSKS